MTKFELMMIILFSVHLFLELAIIGILERIAERGTICKVWLCRLCRIEHRERKWAKSDYYKPSRVFRGKSNEITFEDERTREKAK